MQKSTKRSYMGNTMLVHPSQQKNPLLTHVHNIAWEVSDAIKVDYVVGQTTGALYLSLRYHRLYPNYIYERMANAKQLYVVRLLLVHVDVENHHAPLCEINRLAVLNGFTLVLAWSLEEAGRYLETFKMFEHKSPDSICEKQNQDDYYASMTDCLTQVKSVNKTDVLTLMSTFGSLKNIADTSTDKLAICPGFGEQKVKQLQQVWDQPFLEK
jgi:DNA excision repair protein ERCC-1